MASLAIQKRDELFQTLEDFGWKKQIPKGIRPSICRYEFLKGDWKIVVKEGNGFFLNEVEIIENEIYNDYLDVHSPWTVIGWNIDDNRVEIFRKESVVVEF